jgi:hypothetical protein
MRSWDAASMVRTDEDEDAISIILLAFSHPLVFFLCYLAIHVEERA